MLVRRIPVVAALGMAIALAVFSGSGPVTAASATLGIDHDGGAPDINSGPAAVTPSNDVTISLIVKAPPVELGSWTVDITYDPAVLSPLGCVTYPAGKSVCNPAFSATELRVSGADATGVGGVFNLADLRFEAIGPAGKCSAIALEVVTLTDPVGTGLDPVVIDGQVCTRSPSAPSAGAFVGEWEAIHPDPAIPDAELSIRGHHVSFNVSMRDAMSGFCVPDGPATARGTGRLDAAGRLVLDLRFRCLADRSRSVVPFTFTLAPGDPNQMVDQTGLVWHRVGG